MPRKTLEERLYGRVRIERHGKWRCWIFLGHKNRCGYGQIFDSRCGRTRPAHLVSYELEYGPIPKGLEPNHNCRVRACINPIHITPMTHLENVRYGTGATETHCARGHERTPENTYTRPSGKSQCLACAEIKRKEHYERNADRLRAKALEYFHKRNPDAGTRTRITAFGEEKTMLKWSQDSRCQVKYQTLWRRIWRHGMDPEYAITAPSMQGKRHN